MILLINICKENLHYYGFVKPIEDILKNNKIKFFTKHYKKLTKKDTTKASKIIICGTSLKDNDFIKDIKKFNWIKQYNKSILGICGGMHILALQYNGKKKKKKQIGLVNIDFKKEFLGLKGKKQVYNLHQYIVLSKEFDYFANAQTAKHKTKPFWGVIFHPEVRNKELIESFVRNLQ